MRLNSLMILVAIIALTGCDREGAGAAARHAGVAAASGLDNVESVTWKVSSGATGRPFRADGTLWVVAKSKLLDLAESDGATRQEVELGVTPTSPVLVADEVAFFGAQKQLHAVDLEKGELWSVKVEMPVEGRPVLADGVLYVSAGALLALDPTTGEEKWKFGSEGAIAGSPSVDRGLVFVTDTAGKMFAIDARSEQKVWVFEAGSGFAPVAVALTAELAVSSTVDGWVVAVFRDTGREKWRYPTSDAISSAVSADRSEVYVGTEAGAVFAINSRTGQTLWERNDLAAVVTQPVFADGMLYVGSDDGNLHALDASTGKTRWSHQLESEPIGVPVIGNGEIFIADTGGRIYGLE